MAENKRKRTWVRRPNFSYLEYHEIIEKMLLGPYEEEWFDSNGIVDNTDSTIGKRLGIETANISAITTSIVNRRKKYMLLIHESNIDFSTYASINYRFSNNYYLEKVTNKIIDIEVIFSEWENYKRLKLLESINYK